MNSQQSQGSQGMEHQVQGPPYPSTTAGLGGLPTKTLDVPLSAVTIFLFILGAILHMTIFQINNRRGHKFIISGVCFGLCMARISANVMRIVWAFRPTNVNIAIAAGVLSNAGVILLFIVNLIFAQRFLRAYHPKLGWSTPGKVLFRTIYTCIGLALVMLICAIVYGFFTMDPVKKDQLHKVSLVGSTFLAALAFLPIPMVTAILLLPGRANPVDRFGHGRMRTKIAMVYLTATLLTFGAVMRAVASYMVRPRENPGWFDHKALYYCANYLVELICIYVYGLMRIDRRFHIPDGSFKQGHYMQGVPDHEKKGKKGKKKNQKNMVQETSENDSDHLSPSDVETGRGAEPRVHF